MAIISPTIETATTTINAMFALRLSSQVTWELADGMISVVLVDHVTWGVRVWVDFVASGQKQTAIKRMLHVKVRNYL